jgi:hypothetical protein
MAVNEYITICTSGSEISKKFYAILNGYTESHHKAQSIDDNIEGDPLVTNGGIVIRFSYLLKLSYEMADTSFGTKNELIQMYNLNNPNASPSDVLTLIDHYGVSHTVKFEGDLSLNPLTTMIDGEDSYFYTPIKLIEVIDE